MASEIDLFSKPTESSFLVGQVQSEIFSSPDSYYKVLAVSIEDSNITDWLMPTITVTGTFGELRDDQMYRFEGKIVEHKRYGMQFQCDSYHVVQPSSKDGVVDYLSGKQFPGVGKKTAEKIVDELGTDAIQKISDDPHVLDKLKLRLAVKKSIIDNLNANQGMDQIIIGLNDYGFGNNLITSIVDRYGDEALHIIEENPYQLAKEIEGISFRRADEIAQKIGIKLDDPRRISAAILQTLNDLTMQTGDTYTTARPFMSAAVRLLNQTNSFSVSNEQIAREAQNMAERHELHYEDKRIYPVSLYKAEYQIADHLHRIMTTEQEKVDEETIDKTLSRVEEESGIRYDEVQVNAIKMAMNNKVMLLTGGPGTGKTTIIRGLVECFAKVHQISLDIKEYKDESFPVLLAAPTGRAAKRMSESTDLPASTIHRMLGINGREMATDLNSRDIEGSLLIVDEMSMVDTLLFKILVQAIPTSMHVVLVGDKDQLPSVGPGQVFHDLLNFSELPKVELTNIHRQSEDSTIIPLAHAIKEGRLPADLTSKKADRSFIPLAPGQVYNSMKFIIETCLQRGFPVEDVQILAPMYGGQAGVDSLNQLAQELYNPPAEGKQEVVFRNETFRVGDKVLQTVNSPENNVFNGDMGKIVAIESKKGEKGSSMTVDFDGNEVNYSRMEWSQLKLAYAISIHKSQGSQFKIVLMPVVNQFRRMLQRNLIYTAITRASEKLVIVGEVSAMRLAVQNEGTNRNTTLLFQLNKRWNIAQGEVKTVEKSSIPTEHDEEEPVDVEPVTPSVTPQVGDNGVKILTPEMIENNLIDPMIGMDGIKPEDM
ncbi:MAG: ATP-dependent RecD-like DNA helicase [Limosilactobacillus sp.]|uniref:SF1B family DNA helicase RecD2 n=1 Tax=Limosilactobacillus sp. TaxID=2773925 RepID=UPI00270021B5|nr:ATP-dependent RecD-like DNA helicase [Limosilactobacillus sp.]